MPEISLTSFVDFVVSSGTTRLTKVREIKQQVEQDYSPGRDFYKPVREGIVDYHRGTIASLDLLKIQNDHRKTPHYEQIVNGYKLFLKSESPSFFDPPNGAWSSGDLRVTINPELGLKLKAGDTIVKLYFKSPQLSRQRIDVVLYLMKTALHSQTSGIPLAILDTRRGRPYSYKVNSQDLNALLVGEAAAFSQMWQLV